MTRYAVELGYDTLYVHADMGSASAQISYEDPDGNIVPTPFQTADARHDIQEAALCVIQSFNSEYWLSPEDKDDVTDEDGNWDDDKVREYILDQIERIDADDDYEEKKEVDTVEVWDDVAEYISCEYHPLGASAKTNWTKIGESSEGYWFVHDGEYPTDEVYDSEEDARKAAKELAQKLNESDPDETAEEFQLRKDKELVQKGIDPYGPYALMYNSTNETHTRYATLQAAARAKKLYTNEENAGVHIVERRYGQWVTVEDTDLENLL